MSVPKPDLGFGLTVRDDADDTDPEDCRYPPLLQPQLTHLQIGMRIHPWPSPRLPELAFPAVVYECKSDSSSILYAENQAAGGAAKALCMLEDLRKLVPEEFDKVPVIALCSQGPIWKVFVAFRKDSVPQRGIVSSEDQLLSRPFNAMQTYLALPKHLGRIWSGDISDKWNLFQLQVIIIRISAWLSGEYRVKIAKLVERATSSIC